LIFCVHRTNSSKVFTKMKRRQRQAASKAEETDESDNDYESVMEAQDKRISNLVSTLKENRIRYITRKLEEGIPDAHQKSSGGIPSLMVVSGMGAVLLITGVFLKRRRRRRVSAEEDKPKMDTSESTHRIHDQDDFREDDEHQKSSGDFPSPMAVSGIGAVLLITGVFLKRRRLRRVSVEEDRPKMDISESTYRTHDQDDFRDGGDLE